MIERRGYPVPITFSPGIRFPPTAASGDRAVAVAAAALSLRGVQSRGEAAVGGSPPPHQELRRWARHRGVGGAIGGRGGGGAGLSRFMDPFARIFIPVACKTIPSNSNKNKKKVFREPVFTIGFGKNLIFNIA